MLAPTAGSDAGHGATQPADRHAPLGDTHDVDDIPDPELVAWMLGGSNMDADAGVGRADDKEEEEEEEERARFAKIRERESKAARPW